jgi:predicted XRE-type DNA-binding protein
MDIEGSSGNVYADLGLPDAGAQLAKAQLTARLAQMIDKKALSQRQAAAIVGMTQPKLSTVLRGQFRGVSEAKLLDALRRLGMNVTVTISPAEQAMGSYQIAFV